MLTCDTEMQQCGATVTKKATSSKANTSCRPIGSTSVPSSTMRSSKVPGRCKREKENMQAGCKAMRRRTPFLAKKPRPSESQCDAFADLKHAVACNACLAELAARAQGIVRCRRRRSCGADDEKQEKTRGKTVLGVPVAAQPRSLFLASRGSAGTARCKAMLCRGRGV